MAARPSFKSLRRQLISLSPARSVCPAFAIDNQPADKKLKHQRLIRVKEPRTKNNGDIDIIPAPGRIFGAAAQKPEELISQGLRYQVPEQIVIIDFWTKIRRDKYGR